MAAELTEPIGPPGPDGHDSAHPSAPPAAGLEPAIQGDLLGRYRLLQRLGQGGMGVVHFAVDPHGRAVAVKVLRQHIAGDAEARARLEREVEALSRVRHPRVAPVIDADLHADQPYLVTCYVPGEPLDQAIAARGPLEGEALLRLARGLHGALEAIHAVGIVHRDLKPGNVLLDDGGDPVVIDFGIAHVVDDSRLTSTGLVMGTPGYLSPEIVEGAAVTEATDWWGWAATLVYAATGRPPFGRGPMDVVLARVRAGEFDLDGVDPRLEPLLAAALSPHPKDRPPAPLVLGALELYAAGASTTDALPQRGQTRREFPRPGVAPTRPMPMQPAPYAWPQQAAPQPYAAPQHHATPGYPSQGAPVPGTSEPGYPAQPDYPAQSEYPVQSQHPGHPAYPPQPGHPGAGPQLPGVGAGPVPAQPGYPAYLPAGFHEAEGDPRIGRSDRRGPLSALAAGLIALAVAAPVVALVAALLWSWLARLAERSVTSLVLRRHHYGRRGSDVAVTVAKSPLHLLRSAVSMVLGALMPALMAAAAFSSVVFVVALVHTTRAVFTVPVALGMAMLAGLVTAWWGPGGAALRRGSKSLARGLAPVGLLGGVMTMLGWLAALGIIAWLATRGFNPVWWPLPAQPLLLDVLQR